MASSDRLVRRGCLVLLVRSVRLVQSAPLVRRDCPDLLAWLVQSVRWDRSALRGQRDSWDFLGLLACLVLSVRWVQWDRSDSLVRPVRRVRLEWLVRLAHREQPVSAEQRVIEVKSVRRVRKAIQGILVLRVLPVRLASRATQDRLVLQARPVRKVRWVRLVRAASLA